MAKSSEVRFRARVIGWLTREYIRIIYGEGIGLLDGGQYADVEIDLVPLDLRLPNREFSIVIDSGRIVGIERV